MTGGKRTTPTLSGSRGIGGREQPAKEKPQLGKQAELLLAAQKRARHLSPKPAPFAEDTYYDFGRRKHTRRETGSDFAADQIEGVVPGSVVAREIKVVGECMIRQIQFARIHAQPSAFLIMQMLLARL